MSISQELPIHLRDLEPGCASLAEARRDVRSRCRHYENFSRSSWLLARRLRPALRTIYAFARFSDDLADEEEDLAGQVREAGLSLRQLRRERLLHWASLVERLPATAGRHPILFALAEDARRHGLPLDECLQLQAAFLQDQERPDFPDQGSVLAYCRSSAAPVGRLLLALHGHNHHHPDWPALSGLSDRVCAGMQLANFWQDLSRDLPQGRLYIPRDMLDRHGLPADPLLLRQAGDAFSPLLMELTAWARSLLDDAASLAARLPWRFALDLRLFAGGGELVLARTERLGAAILARRPIISGSDRMRVALRALRGTTRA